MFVVGAAVVGVVAGNRTEKPLELQRTMKIRESKRNRCKEDGVTRKKNPREKKVCRN
jgi:hypothetical protein